ncbi:hypothetical protein KOI40_02740 [Aestuariicella sp. G3-2]|uniref:hypothetical protein n=1 Tax=Pseudomaricurvus albidus TaxID=2842452 RepID=UPI001C0B2ED4|nr:hypothetical protein [Aestuariicella albida]
MLTIRKTIQLAKAHEKETGHLCSLLEKEIPKLHSAIRLPNDNAAEALVDFVTRYIEHVPDFVEAISNVTNQARVFDYAETFLRIAKDYFLHPPELIDGHQGMDALMDEAYLAHRLMEEVNDRFISYCGAPLAPMDMTRSNLIIHHLIGEPFANELDLAVQYSVELCMTKEKVFEHPEFQQYLAEHRQAGWQKELDEWPCLANDLDITLSFTEPEAAIASAPDTIEQPQPAPAEPTDSADLTGFDTVPKGFLH